MVSRLKKGSSIDIGETRGLIDLNKDVLTTNITVYQIVLGGGTGTELPGTLTKALESRSQILPIEDLRDTNLRLSRPLQATLEWDGYQYVASSADLETYGAGETEWEAIDDFRKEVVELYNDLKSNRENLGPNLEKIWHFLESIVIENEN